MIIPSEYYEKLLDIIDPKKLQKTAETDAAGIEKVADTLGITAVTDATNTVINKIGTAL
jgi:hypothetical protein